MSYWNHRVMKHTDESGNTFFAIHEVFYDVEELGNKAWAENPTDVSGESLNDLREQLKRMLDATYKPILNFENGNEL